MDFVPTLINAAVVAIVGVLVTYLSRTQFADLRRELKGEIAELRQDVRDMRKEIGAVRAEIGSLRTETREELASVRGEIGAVRGDLTQLAIALGTHPRPQTG